MKKIILLIIILLNISCNKNSKYENKKYNQDLCKQKLYLETIKNAYHNKNDSIYFYLGYDNKKVIFKEGICFTEMSFKLDHFKTKIYLGLKNDSLFIGEFYNSKINDILFLFSFENNVYPRNLNNTFFQPQSLTIDSIFYKKNETVFLINSFYNSPHDETPRYTIYKYYISDKELIYKVEIMDEITKKIYHTRF